MTEDKNFYLSRLFSEYLKASIQFRKFSDLYEEEKLSYPLLEKETRQPRTFLDDGGIFFKLKELAHRTRKVDGLEDFESSLCWVVETVCSDMFHGLTRVRESFYKSHKNSQHGNQLRISDIKSKKGFGHEDIVESLELILEIDERAKTQAETQFLDLRKIIDVPMKMFKYLFSNENKNHFMKMAVYNSLDNMKTIYGEEVTQDFLRTVYNSDEIGFAVECRNSLIREGFYTDAITINEQLPEPEKKEIKLPAEHYLR